MRTHLYFVIERVFKDTYFVKKHKKAEGLEKWKRLLFFF